MSDTPQPISVSENGEITLSGQKIGYWHKRGMGSAGVIVTLNEAGFGDRVSKNEFEHIVTRETHEDLYNGSWPAWSNRGDGYFQVELSSPLPWKRRSLGDAGLGNLDNSQIVNTVKLFAEKVFEKIATAPKTDDASRPVTKAAQLRPGEPFAQ